MVSAPLNLSTRTHRKHKATPLDEVRPLQLSLGSIQLLLSMLGATCAAVLVVWRTFR